ncbi:MAG: hypothetical protein ACK4VO_00390 [Pseudobdellovibrio sp.]
MKKNIVVTILAILGYQQSFACLGEAQIIARVSSVVFTSATSCHIILNHEDIKHFSASGVCPLDISEVAQSEITVPAIDQGQCSAIPGDMISGVVVKDKNGRLTLE